MLEDDLKVVVLNTIAFGVSMSTIETTLKIVLLIVSIGYTLNRWYLAHKRKK